MNDNKPQLIDEMDFLHPGATTPFWGHSVLQGQL